MRSTTNIIAAIAVAAGALLATPNTAVADSRWEPTESVGVIGDSITWGYGSRIPYGEVARVEHHGVPGACTSSTRCDNHCTYDPTQDGRCGADLWMRDALVEMGNPTTLVILLGTNDLMGNASPAQVKRGLRVLRRQARNLGVERVAFGTLPPFARTFAGGVLEARRLKVNRWVRAHDHVDYAGALENTAGYLRPAYDSGDGLHMSTAGERRMGRVLRSWIDARSN